MTKVSLRSDIQAYTRLMFLMVHYDMGNFNLLPSLVRTYHAYFIRKKLENKVQLSLLQFFKIAGNTPILERKPLMINFLEKLQTLESNLYEKRAFLYLDCIGWLRAKIERRPLGEVIRERTREWE